MKHTPGPWEAAELLPDGHIITRKGTFEIRTPGYDVAAHIPGGAPFRNKADAILAAKAPEMLEALRWLVHLHMGVSKDSGNDVSSSEWQEAIAQACVALGEE